MMGYGAKRGAMLITILGSCAFQVITCSPDLPESKSYEQLKAIL